MMRDVGDADLVLALPEANDFNDPSDTTGTAEKADAQFHGYVKYTDRFAEPTRSPRTAPAPEGAVGRAAGIRRRRGRFVFP